MSNKIADVELDELLRLAKDATPGPWIEACDMVRASSIEDKNICTCWQMPADVKYIAHANPERITRLVECVRELREVVADLTLVSQSKDNEGTDTPQWFVVDPKQNMRADVATAAGQFVGPFFSRERAEAYLKSRRYEYGPKAVVWCASAYYASDYKRLYKASINARQALAKWFGEVE